MTGRHTLVIEAGRSERHYWAEIWRYRELFYFLAWRDVRVRYKQTVLGVAWAVIRPLLAMLVLTIVFGRIANLPSGNVPYPILVFAALLPWQLFASGFSEAGNSLVGNANMISKIYFPRLIIPASAVVVSLLDFIISALLIVVLMIWYGFSPDWRILTLPLFVLFAALTAVGAGLWTAALTVKYRDFRFMVPFAVQLGLYISPVGFSSAVIPEHWRLFYCLNPMVGVIDGFRWALLGGDTPMYWTGFMVSLAVSLLILACGIAYFRSVERSFADVI
jgi:lipopolysaccharide transport system permease protein